MAHLVHRCRLGAERAMLMWTVSRGRCLMQKKAGGPRVGILGPAGIIESRVRSGLCEHNNEKAESQQSADGLPSLYDLYEMHYQKLQSGKRVPIYFTQLQRKGFRCNKPTLGLKVS